MKKHSMKLGLAACGWALIAAVQTTSAITTSGVMTNNETWSGIVTLTGDVTVPDNVTLTILPGTRVAAWDKYDDQAGGLNTSRIELIVNRGILNAVGTSNNPIVFTSSPLHPPALAGDWYGVRVNAGTNTSDIRFCVMEYGIVGLSLEGGNPLVVDGCQFRTNQTGGLSVQTASVIADSASFRNGYGIDVSSRVAITNCWIGDNASTGVQLGAYNLVTILKSTVIRNSAGITGCEPVLLLSDSYIVNNSGIGVANVSAIGAGNLVATNCFFTNNVGSAIRAQGAATLLGCLVDDNGGAGYGEWAQLVFPRAYLGGDSYAGGSVTISNSVIRNAKSDTGGVMAVSVFMVNSMVDHNPRNGIQASSGTILNSYIVSGW